MPPIPILVLLSFIGLILYGTIGYIAMFFVFKYVNPDRQYYKRQMRALAGRPHGDSDVFQAFVPAVAIWPALVTIALWVGTVVALAAGPIWVTRKIGAYVGNAALGAES
jgi:hypothetical protein